MTSELKQNETEFKKHGYQLDAGNMTIDLVCGMEIERADSSSEYGGETYYFCSEPCKNHFDANPKMYIG